MCLDEESKIELDYSQPAQLLATKTHVMLIKNGEVDVKANAELKCGCPSDRSCWSIHLCKKRKKSKRDVLRYWIFFFTETRKAVEM